MDGSRYIAAAAAASSLAAAAALGFGCSSALAGDGPGRAGSRGHGALPSSSQAPHVLAALARIDAAHALVPPRAGTPLSELQYCAEVERWVRRLSGCPAPATAEAEAGSPLLSATLLLAARAQHLERHAIPRKSFPMGRAGYLRWRVAQKRRQAQRVAELLTDTPIFVSGGTDDGTDAAAQDKGVAAVAAVAAATTAAAAAAGFYPGEVQRVQKLVGKTLPLGQDADMQLIEDAVSILVCMLTHSLSSRAAVRHCCAILVAAVDVLLC
eukprot:SAG22_NODE_147_length_17533_cov_46.384536_18_plen_268_part_00